MEDYVFLIGNGINNINTSYTWCNLLKDLIHYIGAEGQIQIDHKPFPLLYEEIVAQAIRKRKLPEIEIKQFIIEQICKLKPNEIHREIINTQVRHILTTNYDFTLEQVLTSQTDRLKNEGTVKENRYSIFRHHQLEQKHFWHIHGDRNHLSSITLGYEHYSGYLQQMRNYIATGASYTKLTLEPLIRRITPGKFSKTYSWLDFFFVKDVYIIGLTLDFIEIHLWWLLTYRLRIIRSKKIPRLNNIIYFYPDKLEDTILHKLQLLNSYEIKTISIPFDPNCKDYYLCVLNKIANDEIR